MPTDNRSRGEREASCTEAVTSDDAKHTEQEGTDEQAEATFIQDLER
jgi:hypothetical protein